MKIIAFFLFQHMETDSEVHWTSYTVDIGVFLIRSMKLATRYQLVSRLRMTGALPLLLR